MAQSYGRGIATPRELSRRSRRLDLQNHNVEHVVALMRGGARLVLHYHKGRPTGLLDPGGEVAAKTAADVIKHTEVYGVGDCLFAGGTSQTYRFVS